MQGIYAIKNKINQKVYVGQVGTNKTFKRRIVEHRSLLRNNKHFNRHLQNAWNLYGEQNFEFFLLEEVENPELLVHRETHWIRFINNCYNIVKNPAESTGRPHTVDAKQRIIAANKRRIWTAASKQRLSDSQKKKEKISDETRMRMSESHKGKKHTEEAKTLISIGNKGKVISDATRQKISSAAKGRIPNKDGIEKRKQTMRQKKGEGYKGVRKRTKNCWQARITDQDCNAFHIGSFDNPVDAAMNYDYYAIRFYGDKTALNFPNKDYTFFIPKRLI